METKNNNGEEFYTIPTTHEQPTSLESGQKETTGLEDIVGKDGLIQVQLEKDTVIERLSKDIYKNPLSALRELVNNEARSCRTAIKLGHDAEMHLSLNPKSRSITIAGNDSMGMTLQIFRDVYTVIGRSGNLDDSESGMFGFGRISYVGLSDTIVVETHARETGEKYCFLGKGGKVIEPMPKPLRESFGTKVQLVIRDGIQLEDVVKYLKKICKFLHVPVFLNMESELGTIEPGMHQIGPVSEKDFLNEANQFGVEKRYDEDTHWVLIENDDYRLVAVYSGSTHNVEDNSYSYLIGIPIEIGEIPNPGFSAYVLNVKNERKYMPVASRDSLDDKSKEKLMEKIQADLEKMWGQIKVESINDYFSLSPLEHQIVSDDGGYWKKHLPFRTQRFCELRHLRVKSIKKSDDTERHPDGINMDYYTSVKEHLAQDSQYCYMYTATKKRIRAALDLAPNMTVFIPRCDVHEKRNTISHLEGFDIRNATELFKENKIKPNGNAAIVLHSHGGTSRINESEVQPDDIRVNDIKHYSGIIRSWNLSPIRVFKDSKKISAGLQLEQYVSNIYKLEFETSKGKMTGKQILSKKGQVYFVNVENSKFKDEIDYSLCQTIVPRAKIFAKTDDDDNITRLRFVNIVKKHNVEFRNFDSGFDVEIAQLKTKSLGMSISEGKWLDEPEQALQHLSKLSKSHLRELYAKIYDGGWSDKKQSKKIANIEKILTDAEKQTSELDEALSMYDATANKDYSWDDPQKDIRDFAKSKIKELGRQPKIFEMLATKILGKIKIEKVTKKYIGYSHKTWYHITYAEKNVLLSANILKPFDDMLSMELEIISVNVKNEKTKVILQT